MQYVYLLRAGANHYKIGIASNVKKRVASIQTGNANLVEVVTTKMFTNALAIEKQLHSRLLSMRTNGGQEWFELTADQAIEMAVAINRMPGVDLDNRVTVAQVLESQRRIEKYFTKKLDFVINNYQKSLKPKAVVEPDVYGEPKLTAEDLDDIIYQEALTVIKKADKASTSLLQRELRIGYGRAARIMAQLEKRGIISPADGSKPREVFGV